MMPKGFKHTGETKRNMRDAHRGKKHTEKTKRKMRKAHLGEKNPMYGVRLMGEKNSMYGRTGENNPRYGKKLSTISKEKMSKSRLKRKEKLGYVNSIDARNKMSKTRTGKGNPMYGVRRTGEKNPNWRGGITPSAARIRKSLKYQEWRQRVFIRDGFICWGCGQKGGCLEAHHNKSFKQLLIEVKKYLPLFNLYDGAMIYDPLWDISNGITLCKKCHDKIKKMKGYNAYR